MNGLSCHLSHMNSWVCQAQSKILLLRVMKAQNEYFELGKARPITSHFPYSLLWNVEKIRIIRLMKSTGVDRPQST